MAKLTPEQVVRAFKRNAVAESKERLNVALDTIDGLVKPMLEQGLVDLEGVDEQDLERLFQDP